MNTRDDNIDALKGIGILCVLFGHVLTWGKTLSKVFFAFHVPMFFLISGLFAKTGCESFGELFRRICRNYVFPYFFFTIAGLCVIPFRSGIGLDMHLARSVFLDFHPAVNGPVWFLAVLAMTQVAFWVFRKYVKLDESRLLVAIVALSAGCVIAMQPSARVAGIPFKAGAVPFAFLIFAAGSALKNKVLKFFDRNHSCAGGLFCLLVLSAMSILIARIAPASNCGIPMMKSIASIPACITGIMASMYAVRTLRLDKIRPLAHIGRNSLFFFCLDYVALPVVVKLSGGILPGLSDASMPVLSHKHGIGTSSLLFIFNLVAVSMISMLVKPFYDFAKSALFGDRRYKP